MIPEILIPMIPHSHNFMKTLHGFKEFYTKTAPDSWPDMYFTAIGKSFSYEEYTKLLNKVLKLEEQFEDSAEICSVITSEPPRQDYPTFLNAFSSGGDIKEAGKIDNQIFEVAQKHWEETRNEFLEITKEIFNNNEYVQLQVFPKNHKLKNLNSCWWFFIKENPHKIHANFYPRKPDQNRIVIETLMKPSLRYRLGC